MSDIQVNIEVVREVLNSPGVMDALRTECEAAAQRCNGIARFHAPFEADPYGAHVHNARYCAMGYVSARRIGRDGMAAIRENAAHNTMLKGSGW